MKFSVANLGDTTGRIGGVLTWLLDDLAPDLARKAWSRDTYMSVHNPTRSLSPAIEQCLHAESRGGLLRSIAIDAPTDDCAEDGQYALCTQGPLKVAEGSAVNPCVVIT